jgi:hypothetical protein
MIATPQHDCGKELEVVGFLLNGFQSGFKRPNFASLWRWATWKMNILFPTFLS